MSEIENGRLDLDGTEHSKCDHLTTLGFKGLREEWQFVRRDETTVIVWRHGTAVYEIACRIYNIEFIPHCEKLITLPLTL